jgi:hypothetical protein
VNRKIWHHYLLWEDFKAGMWRSVYGAERKQLLEKAIAFTGDHLLYGSYMRRVIKEWPLACEQNLTDPNINRLAWLGQAACCMAISCPEDITREAWGRLTQKQQDDADAQAEQCIEEWELNFARKNNLVYKQMAFAGL